MDITISELKIISDEKGYNIYLIEKDYLITYLLFLIRDVKNIYFKGGTAINKIFLNHARLSEDLDFTLTGKLSIVEKEVKNKLKGTIFSKITHDKKVAKFVRLIIHYKLFHDEGAIFMDLNERAKLLDKPERHKLPHFYKNYIPSFSINTLSKNELIAEKMAASIVRNKPRDHFDMYKIISKKIPVDLNLVKKKCKASGHEFNIISMFKRANKLKKRWDEDVAPLIAEKITFQEVMKTLARHFNLKGEKEKQKKEKLKHAKNKV